MWPSCSFSYLSYLFLKCGITDLANIFKDFRSGRSGKCMVKYLTSPKPCGGNLGVSRIAAYHDIIIKKKWAYAQEYSSCN